MNSDTAQDAGGLLYTPPTKADARRAALARRTACNPTLGVPMSAHILRDCPPPAGAIVAGFWPLQGEVDTRFLLQVLHLRGHAVVLPQTPPRGQALTFHRWRPEDTLIEGRFGTRHTDGEILQPDFVLVPLLAFDADGNRLGYGGGYYDRTLAALPNAFRLGCGFAAQEIDIVPVEPHDQPLHAIATELGVLTI
jgi:5-formyltetrahydrofolate cyclo-ligase